MDNSNLKTIILCFAKLLIYIIIIKKNPTNVIHLFSKIIPQHLALFSFFFFFFLCVWGEGMVGALCGPKVVKPLSPPFFYRSFLSPMAHFLL